MLKMDKTYIGKFNLIGTFVLLIVFAFSVVLLSTKSSVNDFIGVEKDIKNKFLENKKDDIRFNTENINALIKSLEEKNPQTTEENKKFILDFVKKMNQHNPNPISILPLEEDSIHSKELLEKGKIFIYNKNFDKEMNEDIFVIEYYFLNPNYNWIISSKFEDYTIYEEIRMWKKHLNSLLLDNIYVHISLLFFFSIALLLVAYIINKQSNKTLENCKNTNKKVENDLKEEIFQLKREIEDEKNNYKEQEKIIQKQSKMVALGEMLSNLSNQWRQPLLDISKTAIDVKNTLTVQKTPTEEDLKNLSCIDSSAQYLSRTIDDFKVFLKADSLKIDFIVNEIIDKSLAINDSILKKNKIKVLKNLDTPLSIHNLSFGLLQALVNIMYNSKDALKNMPEDERYIFITTRNHAQSIEIIVTDTGNGIPEAIMKDIFKPYFTTKQKTYGTGLGLHMAFNIIEQNMSGKLSVQNKIINYENKKFKGASFKIELKIDG